MDVSFIDTDFLCSIQNSYLRESYKSQYIAAISGSYLFNNPNTGKGNSITVRVNAETAGNLTDALAHWLSSPVSEQVDRPPHGTKHSTKYPASATRSISAWMPVSAIPSR